jgi:hypothetical protein
MYEREIYHSMPTRRKHRFGNTGLVAQKVFENFEVCLMLIAAFLFGGIMTSVVSSQAGVAMGLIFTTGISVGVGLTLVAADLFVKDGY